MHPLFSRTGVLGAYLLLWAGLGGALGLTLSLRLPGLPWSSAILGLAPLAVVYGMACLAAWFVCRAFPVEGEGRLTAAVLAQLTAAAVTSGAWVAAGLWWLQTSAARLSPTSVDGVVLWFGAGMFGFLLSSAVHYVFLAVQASELARREALESAVLAREAELRALRAQVNPHFLYNSLHSIAALAPSRPTHAQQMAVGLGEFLRQSLRLGSLPVVTLEQEVNLSRQYLAIEGVRYAERLTVEIAVDQAVAPCHVPPLLLQPLVENAIKHGVAGMLEGGTVSLVARRDGGTCEVVVSNAYDPDEPRRPGTGMGMDNVRARLAAHFGRHGTLESQADGTTFRVCLRWPMLVAASTDEQEVAT